MPSPNNLPHQLTSFVGREREMREVRRLLEGARMLTLTGPGGCGKTRLALEVVAGLLDSYPDGAWLVELATLSDPSLLPQVVAAAIGVREEPGRPLAATLVAFFEPRSVLLLLDNCEHLAAACAELGGMLLRSCPGLRVLATSRQPLGVGGEVAWPVPPLSTPDPARDYSPEELLACEAVELFVARARLCRPDFAITAENGAAVAQLCRRLDGIPLAVELAAARLKVLSVEQIVARLDERFRLLSAPAGALPHHQTLRAVMDWSYDLLSEAERSLFRGLAVFAGGFDLPAALAVCGDMGDEYQLIDLLSRLADRSLLLFAETSGAARYHQLETIREYALARLAECGELDTLRRRHRDWCLSLAEQSEDQLITGAQGQWLARLEVEHDNLRAALRWSQEVAGADGGEVDAALRLAGALVWFWYFHGYLSEGREWLEGALQVARAAGQPAVPTPALAKVLNAAGALAFLQSDLAAARSRLEESLAAWGELGDRRGMAFALAFLARAAVRLGDPRGHAMGEESAAIFRALGDPWGLALVLDFLGEQARDRGDHGRAAALHAEALSLYKELGHTWGVALELSNLGRVALARRDYAAAWERLEEALAIQRAVGDKWSQAWILQSLAAVALARRDLTGAASLYAESLALFRELGDAGGIAQATRALQDISQQQNNPAARPPAAAPHAAAPTPAAAGHPAPASPGAVRQPGNYPADLTPREVDVLRLVAEGLTDAQIAARLYLSTRTVQAHLRSIYSKLDVTTRSAATRFAIEHQLA